MAYVVISLKTTKLLSSSYLCLKNRLLKLKVILLISLSLSIVLFFKPFHLVPNYILTLTLLLSFASVTWSSNICTASWFGHSMKVSSMYLSHSGAIPKAISLKYFMYIFAITSDIGEPIAKKHSSYCYLSTI